MARVEFFFQDIFALYETTRVHQCKIMSPGDHQLMLSSNTQGWQKRVGRMGICPPSFWQNRRCLWEVAALLLLAYTKQLEFISVIISPGDHQLICHMQKLIEKVKKITHFQKISRKWQGQHISSYSWPILDFGQREVGALLILAYIKQIECILWVM